MIFKIKIVYKAAVSGGEELSASSVPVTITRTAKVTCTSAINAIDFAMERMDSEMDAVVESVKVWRVDE